MVGLNYQSPLTNSDREEPEVDEGFDKVGGGGLWPWHCGRGGWVSSLRREMKV